MYHHYFVAYEERDRSAVGNCFVVLEKEIKGEDHIQAVQAIIRAEKGATDPVVMAFQLIGNYQHYDPREQKK